MISPSDILAALGDPVIALDRSGCVIVWTPAAERLLGYTEAEVLGRALPDIGIRRETLVPGRERRLSLRRRSGPALPATVTATELLGSDGSPDGVVLLVKALAAWIGTGGEDIPSAEVQAVEERLGAAFRGIVEATGADLERAGRLEPLAQSLAEQGRRLLPGISCLIALVPAARQDVLSCLAGAGPLAETLIGRSVARQGTALGLALAEDRVIESTDMQRLVPTAELVAANGLQTMRAIPMSTQQPLPDGRRSLGAIAFFRGESRPFTRAERRLLDDFGALVAITLQRAEFRAATERSMTRLQLAVDVALDLARSLDVGEVVKRLVRRAAVATRADRCSLLRLEGGEEGETTVADTYDVSGYDSVLGFRQAVAAQQYVREAVASRTPVLGGHYELSDFPARLEQAMAQVRHTATVPLLNSGEVVALLALSRRRDPPFGSDEVETLVLLSGPAALALRNSYLYARTEEASRVKTDFLDMAAHELRTPLTVISGYLSILREGAFGPVPASWEEPLRILDAKAAELRRLVDDLLLAARLETGRLETVLEPLDFRDVVKQAARATIGAPADAARLLEMDLPPRAVMVRGDREQLSRMLGHLVTNALVYVQEGAAPWARVTLEYRPERGEARLAVEDRGRGLAPGAGERIFERFTRLEDPDHPMVPGTGLGLYIARELAIRHGGRLDLEWTQPGLGSRFAVRLPLLRARATARPGSGDVVRRA